MLGFDFFRHATEQFRAKTPRTAMKAVEARVLPMEAFISMGASAKSLAEEPYDLLEIERVLARENLDLKTNLLLVDVFRKLIKNPDQEVALFAAESVNLIENRYNQAIEKTKEELGSGRNPAKLLELARLYYEYSQLYREVAAMKGFYLREALSYVRMLPDNLDADRETVRLLVLIFVELRLYDQALMAIEQYGRGGEEAFFLMLRAEVEFRRRNFIGVFQICTWLLQRQEQLDRHQKLLIEHWLGRR